MSNTADWLLVMLQLRHWDVFVFELNWQVRQPGLHFWQARIDWLKNVPGRHLTQIPVFQSN